MASENKGGGKTVATAGILALLLMLGGGGYFGLGPGKDILPGNGDTVKEEQSAGEAEAPSGKQEQEAEQEEKPEVIPDVIVVSIKKDKVTINGHEVEDETALRQYIEEYNSDSRTFTLEEEESILDTYNWVKGVFDDLDIQLKNSR